MRISRVLDWTNPDSIRIHVNVPYIAHWIHIGSTSVMSTLQVLLSRKGFDPNKSHSNKLDSVSQNLSDFEDVAREPLILGHEIHHVIQENLIEQDKYILIIYFALCILCIHIRSRLIYSRYDLYSIGINFEYSIDTHYIRISHTMP